MRYRPSFPERGVTFGFTTGSGAAGVAAGVALVVNDEVAIGVDYVHAGHDFRSELSGWIGFVEIDGFGGELSPAFHVAIGGGGEGRATRDNRVSLDRLEGVGGPDPEGYFRQAVIGRFIGCDLEDESGLAVDVEHLVLLPVSAPMWVVRRVKVP